MNVLAVITFALLLGLAAPSSVLAKDKPGKGKGPSESAYEHANANASFKRDGDWSNANKKGRKDKSGTDRHHDDEDSRHSESDAISSTKDEQQVASDKTDAGVADDNPVQKSPERPRVYEEEPGRNDERITRH